MTTEDAYREGFDAFILGRAINPYRRKSREEVDTQTKQLADAWDRGFIDSSLVGKHVETKNAKEVNRTTEG